ncbi:DUF3846 domain-containing protein [Dietzia sp. MNB45]|uniref:DUF3846 domain-containing protein n=1 Tax=Dietzia sp. MNB45 TaxID=3238800 RepID=UPI003F7EE6CA
MTTITGLFIPCDGELPIEEVTLEGGDYRLIKGLIGGLFQVVEVPNHPASFFVDEEGMLKTLPVNNRGTLLLWELCFDMHVNLLILLGNVLVLGKPDAVGNTTSAPQDLIDEVLSR